MSPAVIVVLLCAILFNSSLIEGKSKHPVYYNGPVCTTSTCNKTASQIKQNLDESHKPCTDFYRFACGGFISRAHAKNYATQYSYFEMVENRVMQQLEQIFNERPSTSELKPFSFLKHFYRFCMDTITIENDGLKHVQALIKKLGGWPLLEGDNWSEKDFDWQSYACNLRKLGLPSDGIVGVSVSNNPFDNTKMALMIGPPDLGLEHRFLARGPNNEKVKVYYDLLVDLAVKFGALKGHAEKEIRDALNFEINLARMTEFNGKQQNVSSYIKPMTLEDMQKDFPSTNWVEFVNNMIDDVNQTLTASTTAHVIQPQFFTKLESLFNLTSKRVQANYLTYRILLELTPYLPQHIRKHSPIDEDDSYLPRSGECIELAASRMPLAVGAMYARQYFNNTSRNNVEELTKNIKSAYLNTLEHVEWMDYNTRTIAREKAVGMVSHIGYPKELMEDEALNKYYAKLTAPTGHFMEFVLAINKFSTDKNFEKLSQTYKRSDWTDEDFEDSIKVRYSYKNIINVPAEILQNPFFNQDRPNYLNYGSVGFLIGHEMMHAFDEFGSQFDKEGSFKEWWSSETKKAYIKKARCLVDQYGKYFSLDAFRRVNGHQTLKENLADNAGLKEAYLAYEDWVRIHGEEHGLPNIRYTPRQLFWISAANTLCTAIKSSALKQQIINGKESPARFRIAGSISNNPLFARDFNCARGSKMNPSHKCNVW